MGRGCRAVRRALRTKWAEITWVCLQLELDFRSGPHPPVGSSGLAVPQLLPEEGILQGPAPALPTVRSHREALSLTVLFSLLWTKPDMDWLPFLIYTTRPLLGPYTPHSLPFHRLSESHVCPQVLRIWSSYHCNVNIKCLTFLCF